MTLVEKLRADADTISRRRVRLINLMFTTPDAEIREQADELEDILLRLEDAMSGLADYLDRHPPRRRFTPEQWQAGLTTPMLRP